MAPIAFPQFPIDILTMYPSGQTTYVISLVSSESLYEIDSTGIPQEDHNTCQCCPFIAKYDTKATSVL